MQDATCGDRAVGTTSPHWDGEPMRDAKPILVVLHQEHSNPGHIGQVLQAQGHALDVRKPRFGDALPETLDHHDGAVIFGGPMSANDPDDYVKRETDWIGVALREKAPFLGVCLGGQMLAKHLGGTVFLHEAGHVEIGYHPVRPLRPVYAEGDWPSFVYQWHKEGFTVPRGCDVLMEGGNAFPSQAFEYGPTAVGIQFHPEITYAMISRWSGHNPHKLTQPGAKDRASQLRDHIAHGPAIRTWLDRFLRSWVREGRQQRAI